MIWLTVSHRLASSCATLITSEPTSSSKHSSHRMYTESSTRLRPRLFTYAYTVVRNQSTRHYVPRIRFAVTLRCYALLFYPLTVSHNASASRAPRVGSYMVHMYSQEHSCIQRGSPNSTVPLTPPSPSPSRAPFSAMPSSTHSTHTGTASRRQRRRGRVASAAAAVFRRGR